MPLSPQAFLIPALIIVMVMLTPQSEAQALYQLNRTGQLTQLRHKDVTVRGGYSAQPVFYSQDTDGTLTGWHQPATVRQEPGKEVALATSPGRLLEVIKPRVNVRKGPGLGATITTQLERGARVISLEHAGAWVSVAPAGSGSSLGWVYEPLLAEVFAYSSAQGNTPLGRFQRTLEQLRNSKENGNRYGGLGFAEVSEGAMLSLVASEAWLGGQAADRWDTVSHLGSTWRTLAPPNEIAVLNVLNEQGQRQMTVIRP